MLVYLKATMQRSIRQVAAPLADRACENMERRTVGIQAAASRHPADPYVTTTINVVPGRPWPYYVHSTNSRMNKSRTDDDDRVLMEQQDRHQEVHIGVHLVAKPSEAWPIVGKPARWTYVELTGRPVPRRSRFTLSSLAAAKRSGPRRTADEAAAPDHRPRSPTWRRGTCAPGRSERVVRVFRRPWLGSDNAVHV